MTKNNCKCLHFTLPIFPQGGGGGWTVAFVAKVPENFQTSRQAIGILLSILVKQMKNLEFFAKIHKNFGMLSQLKQLTLQLLHSSHTNGVEVFGTVADFKYIYRYFYHDHKI